MQNAVGLAAAVILIPLAVASIMLLKPFMKPIELTPDEIARYLRNFIEDSGGEWDWDDFESVEIADPILDSIRRRAASIEDPGSEEGLTKLRDLLAEAESLIAK